MPTIMIATMLAEHSTCIQVFIMIRQANNNVIPYGMVTQNQE